MAVAVEENVDEAILDEPSPVPETGSPTKGMRVDSEDEIPTEKSIGPAAPMHEEPSSSLPQTTNESAKPKPLFLESESESDDYVPPVRPPPARKPPSAKAKAAPRSAKVVGRRIASDSESESDAPAAIITPERPSVPPQAGPSSLAGPRSASNQALAGARRAAIIDLSSDEDESAPLPVTATNASAPGYVSVIGTKHPPSYAHPLKLLRCSI